jgi:2,4-dienoyl-CoA reductase-like NADH-dependent reductase (Old Yellow Enzyme family)
MTYNCVDFTETLYIQTNRRVDAYSCSSSNALNFLHRIVTSIREVVPDDFILGVKVNASDYVDASTEALQAENISEAQNQTKLEFRKCEQELEALEHVRTMASWLCIDFIEVSGGDYETPGKIYAP